MPKWSNRKQWSHDEADIAARAVYVPAPERAPVKTVETNSAALVWHKVTKGSTDPSAPASPRPRAINRTEKTKSPANKQKPKPASHRNPESKREARRVVSPEEHIASKPLILEGKSVETDVTAVVGARRGTGYAARSR